LALFVFCLVLGPSVIHAQQTESATAVAVPELEALVAVIKDKTAREQLLSQIQALIAISKKPPQVEPSEESSVSRLIEALSENVNKASRQLMTAAYTLRNVPVLFSSLRDRATDSKNRERWLELIIKLVIILFASGAAERILRLLMKRPRQALEEQDADTFWVRLPLLTGRTLLDLMPLAAFAAVAYAVALLVRPSPQVHVIALTLINAYLIVRGILAVARMLLAPAAKSLRILPLADVTANYLFIWTRRFVSFSVFGFFFAEVLLLLGLPGGGYISLLRLIGLIATGLVVVFLLQNREQVANWVRGEEWREERTRRTRRLRDRFADIWHVLAIIYVVATFGVWALGIEGGFRYMAQATAGTVIILVAAQMIMTGLDRLVKRSFTIRQEIRDRFPTLEGRANRYLPTVRLFLRWLVGVITALALLEIWGVDALGWLDTPLGKQVVESGFVIISVAIMALVLWETLNVGIERYLTHTYSEGKVVERSARIRTLLPLFRKVVFTVMVVMVSMIMLSELGIDIGPLLAGAGVIGLAVGFGAQTLVKDIITGLFILVEDTIAVGDYVEVGGHEGTVESFSIRTIRLRDPDGSVHTVPFSEVGAVLNYTKEFSNVVLNIGIAYRENVDEVMKVIEDLGQEMAADQILGPDIVTPLVAQGIQSLDDSAVVIRAKMSVKAGTQWGMKREFNRRMKNRFDELGIEIPFPQRTISFVEENEGNPLNSQAPEEHKQIAKGRTRNVRDSGDASDGGDSD